MIYKWNYKTPDGFSDMIMNSDGEYLTGLWFEGSGDVSKHSADCEERNLPVFEETTRWLDLYFSGQAPDFTPAYRLQNLTSFRKEVIDIMNTIPFGETLTYGDISEKIAKNRGLQRMSAQAVGGAVGWNPICIIIPCHRVMRANGKLTGYGGGIQNKAALLAHEGQVKNTRKKIADVYERNRVGEADMNHIERRDCGMAYISDASVMEEQRTCRKLLHRLNTADPSDFDELQKITKEILGKSEDAFINPPFHCDYGTHIEVGKNFFANYNCTILDVAKVKIGDNCQFAPNVAIYTAGHPLHPVSRNSMFEYGIEVVIGDNVWIGGNTVILPGVHIGNNTVIGAGSVVTKDIPDWVVAAGNPCRVIRNITEKDKRYYYRDREFDEEAWEMIQKMEESEK